MNILFYIPDLSQTAGGIRQYACALLKTLAQDTENTYFVLNNTQDEVVYTILKENRHLVHIPSSASRPRKYEKLITDGTKLLNMVLKSRQKTPVSISSYVNRICRKYNIDIVHCPYQHAPFTSYPTIATMHDVQELHLPELFTPRERAERATIFMGIAERATHIVVSFEHVRQDMIRFFQRSLDDVSVCSLSLENLWFDRFTEHDIIPTAQLGVPMNFCLYPAATWPHKNHIRLLDAMSYLRDQYGLVVNMVFTGHQTPHFQAIQDQVERLQLSSQAFFLNIVDEVTLYSLYKQARAVIIPTLYEAGSFPLYESIFLNVPVVCSSITSLPETIGDPQFLFDPQNITEMANQLQGIVTNEDMRTASRTNNRQAQELLRNRNPLADVKRVYKKVMVLK